MSGKINYILLYVIIQSSKDYCANKWIWYMTEQIRVWIRKQRQVLTSSAHSKLKRKKFSHLYNGPLAVGTTRREELMVVFVTVRPSLSLKEACGAQLHLTGSTHKVFRVPHFTQSCDHLQNREKKNKCSGNEKRFVSVSSFF